MSTYQSVTTWQAEDFEVEVYYGFFSTVAEAAEMARDGIKRIFVDGLCLWIVLRNGTRAPVRDGGFIVRRLREGARNEAGQRVLTIDDFDVIPMTAEAMRNEPDMRSFGSLSYGVIDANGEPVALPRQY
ncbi:hypothetical protein HDE78_003615 [Rhodanobacter sp. K2T2]|uniref:hypothetical protein n=1 Tax=Rhodanobacter sp. K2T2 TaxID=2723085 RepID=UPI0015C8DAE4|nr:hypothetical protein [Rhodanobacter sp. K2T2]NYE30640.1 hypothetical protein [Rhodanobacter sp. K2T2]